MPDQDHLSPLQGDPRRQAFNSMGGTFLQVWHSVLAWIELKEDEVLYLECAEDFDIIRTQGATAVQVKASANTISLGSKDAQEGIANFWHLTELHPERKVAFRFLTRAKVGPEKGKPFGNQAGLHLWRECTTEPGRAVRLQQYLSIQDRLPERLRAFAATSSPEEFVKRLILPFTWETDAPSADKVELAVIGLLSAYGEQFGIGYTDASNARHPLYTQVCTTIRQHKVEDRRLDRLMFRQTFEAATTECVPKQRMRDLERTEQVLLQRVLDAGWQSAVPEANRLELQPSPQFTFGVPPLLAIFVPRIEILDRAGVILKKSGRVVFSGSVGSGKITLAKLLVGRNPGSWIWVDLTGNPDRTPTTLWRLFSFLARNTEAKHVVLDNAELRPQEIQKFQEQLGALAALLKQRNGLLIITSQRTIPRKSARDLGFDIESNITVHRFKLEDVVTLCARYGCSDPEECHRWSSRIHGLASGHPQLVHGMVQFLADDGWPQCSTAVIARLFPQIALERAEARTLALSLPDKPRELLYRLSLVASPFRRDHAMEIAGAAQALDAPGDSFDRLIGAWIEPITGEYYRVSPLIVNEAIAVWGPTRLRELHLAIADAVASCGDLTQTEVSTLLFHAYAGESDWHLTAMCRALNQSSKEIWEATAQQMTWLPLLKLQAGEVLYEQNPTVSILLRHVQFRIALHVDERLATRVMNAWRREVEACEPQQLAWFHEFDLAISATVIDRGPAGDPAQLLGDLLTLDRLQRAHADFFAEFFSDKTEYWDRVTGMHWDASDLVRSVAVFVGTRCRELERFKRLLDALEACEPDFRGRVLDGFCDRPENLSHIVEAVWVNEADKESPDWPGCLEVFEKVVRLGMSWGKPVLADTAIRGVAVIMDEYQHEPEAALEALDRLTAGSGRDSALTRNARALVLFHLQRFDEALELWRSTLPMWSVHDLTEASALRLAAITAGKLGRWDECATFFVEARRRLKRPILPETTAGSWADTGYALWRAGRNSDAISAFATALRRLERLERLKARGIRTHKVKRLIGQVLLWIAEQSGDRLIHTYDPGPGTCSNLDPMSAIDKLPEADLDLCWYQLIRVEFQLSAVSVLGMRQLPRLCASANVAVRAAATHLLVLHRFRNGDFADLPTLLAELRKAFREARELVPALRQSPVRESSSSQQIKPIQEDGTFIKGTFLVALVRLAAGEGLDRTLFTSWKGVVSEDDPESLYEWLVRAEDLVFGERLSALVLFKNPNTRWDEAVLAALNVLSTPEETTVADLLRAHVLILNMQGNYSDWMRATGTQVSRWFADQWRHKAAFPAGLLTPRLTVPLLLTACDAIDTDGLRKAARIVLAAQPTTDLRFAPGVLEPIRRLAAGPQSQ
jgi:tetratricopeptide (TPR) repeat protein